MVATKTMSDIRYVLRLNKHIEEATLPSKGAQSRTIGSYSLTKGVKKWPSCGVLGIVSDPRTVPKYLSTVLAIVSNPRTVPKYLSTVVRDSISESATLSSSKF